MLKKIGKIKLGIIAGPFFLLCLAAGLAWASSEEFYSYVKLFDVIALTVSDKYVDPVEPQKLIKAGVDGMLNKLDPYSQYLAGADYNYLLQETQGEYSGIGLTLENRNDTLVIASIMESSPARKSPVRIGDRLLMIDSLNVIGKTKSQCLKLMRGDEGSRVRLKLRRPIAGGDIEVDIVRQKILVDPIPFYGLDESKIGYIKIARFSEGSAQEIELVLTQLLEQDMAGLILDLRGNPGGLLYESVEAAALFLKKGDKIVETRGRISDSFRSYDASADGIYTSGPLVVVIDDQTASAAEIVAGAVQDHDRGLVIGNTSYGKGLVQQIFQLTAESALKLTTAKYYTPSERCIQKDTVDQDLVTSDSDHKPIIFYTDSGRPVFGGGGIIPDIYIDKLAKSPMLDELLSKGYVSDFVNYQNSQKPVNDSFTVTDEIIEEFFEYAKSKGYSYQNAEDNAFEQFINQNQLSAKDDKLALHIEAIKNILAERSGGEIINARSQVKDLLYEHFISECLGEKKTYELVWLKNTPELLRAHEIVSNPKAYAGLLAAN